MENEGCRKYCKFNALETINLSQVDTPFLLFMVAYKRAKEKANFKGSPYTLLEKLSAIRLATFIESPRQKTKGKYKVTYCLEEMDKDFYAIAEGMGLTKQKLKTNIPFSVYN